MSETETATVKQVWRLIIVWSSGDREVAKMMAFMYTHNAKTQGWFDEVRLIVWGPSQQLLVSDEGLQAHVRRMQEDGVEVVACKACADQYGIGEQLEALGIEVLYTGQMLSDALKTGWTSLTF